VDALDQLVDLQDQFPPGGRAHHGAVVARPGQPVRTLEDLGHHADRGLASHTGAGPDPLDQARKVGSHPHPSGGPVLLR